MAVARWKTWKLVTSAVTVTVAVTTLWISPVLAIPMHKSTVTIDVRGQGEDRRLFGQVKSENQGCRVRRAVDVWQKVAGPDVKRADNRLTDLNGNWSSGAISLEPGTYYAKVDQIRLGSSVAKYTCLADRSPDVKVS